MRSFDCYVSLSTGEGFAIGPRESLALGIPVIITNNTAHKTICQEGFVKSVPSNIIIPGTYYDFENDQKGYGFDCSIDDAARALKEIYDNYDFYLNKAQKGREWVKQYLKENMTKKYLNLIKPTKILLGNKNIITDDYLMTNSISLYQKYLKIIYKNYCHYKLSKLSNCNIFFKHYKLGYYNHLIHKP